MTTISIAGESTSLQRRAPNRMRYHPAVRLGLGILALAASGCINLQLGTSINTAVSDAPVRRLGGSFIVGAYMPIEDTVVVNPFVGFEAGPLGDRSNGVGMWGGRVTTLSRGLRRPGFYGMGAYGRAAAGGPDGRAYIAGAGVSWSALPKKDDQTFHSWGNVSAGLSYHHQRQDDIGGGHFLGIELAVTYGTMLGYVVQEFFTIFDTKE